MMAETKTDRERGREVMAAMILVAVDDDQRSARRYIGITLAGPKERQF
jgi:hypothetical protein